MQALVNIFEFEDYRLYLNSWIKEAKAKKLSNLNRLAESAHIHPTFLSHILKGNKHLSLEQAAFICEKIGLTTIEQDYFFILLHLDRAGTVLLRNYWINKKNSLLKEKNKLKNRFIKHKELNQEQKAIFYSSWIYAAVWVCTSINEKQSLNEISKLFQISRSVATEVLQFLLEVGLVFEKNGFYTMGESHVHVSNESPFVVKHHLNWRMKAIQKMDSRTNTDLFFTAPMTVSKKDFEKIRENINKLIRDIIETAKNSKSEELVCLNIDLYEALSQIEPPQF